MELYAYSGGTVRDSHPIPLSIPADWYAPRGQMCIRDRLHLDRNILDKPNSLELLRRTHQHSVNLFLIYFYENNIEVSSIFSKYFTYQDCMDSFSNINAVMQTVDSVSYTHLDVYKRQLYPCL